MHMKFSMVVGALVAFAVAGCASQEPEGAKEPEPSVERTCESQPAKSSMVSVQSKSEAQNASSSTTPTPPPIEEPSTEVVEFTPIRMPEDGHKLLHMVGCKVGIGVILDNDLFSKATIVPQWMPTKDSKADGIRWFKEFASKNGLAITTTPDSVVIKR